MKRLCGWLAIASVSLSIGCKPDAAVKQGEVIGRGSEPAQSPPQTPSASAIVAQPDASAPDPATFGSLSGTISFTGAAPRPARMREDSACGSTLAFSEDYVIREGKLANVFLYIKEGPPAPLFTNMPPAVMDEKDCRFLPHVVAIPAGGWVEFPNSGPLTHNIGIVAAAAGNQTAEITQSPKAAPQRIQFKEQEQMIPVRSFNQRWMRAFINVAATPYALSDVGGHFQIKNLPPGNYTLAAVHEKLGEQEIKVTVAAKMDAKADFTYAIK